MQMEKNWETIANLRFSNFRWPPYTEHYRGTDKMEDLFINREKRKNKMFNRKNP